MARKQWLVYDPVSSSEIAYTDTLTEAREVIQKNWSEYDPPLTFTTQKSGEVWATTEAFTEYVIFPPEA